MPSPRPTDAQAAELIAAATAHFGQCDCHQHPDGRACRCAAHSFLTSNPTRRMGVHVWQRLLWMRSQRSALLAQEGLRSPAPTPPAQVTPTVLPW